MATWIVHLRLAEIYLKTNRIPYAREFVLGSVAPDCGYGKKDSYGEFVPPPEVTHWAPDGVKVYCEYRRFMEQYLKDKKRDKDYYFYLGYYIHLLTDIMWSSVIYLPTRTKYADEYKSNPDFLKIIKQDWYDLDFLFMRSHTDFETYKILDEAGEVKNYLPYYEPHQLTTQIRFIADFYKDSSGRVLDRDYPYLSEREMTEFINCAAEIIDYDLNRKNLL